MSDNRLSLIKKYFDTSGVHLNDSEKDLLCNVIDNSGKYNGFTSSIKIEEDSGKDYNGRWSIATKTQYKINIDDSEFSIDVDYHHSCDDGYNNKKKLHLTDVRSVISALEEIEKEL